MIVFIAMFFAFIFGVSILLTAIGLYGDNIFSASFLSVFALSLPLWGAPIFLLIQFCRTLTQRDMIDFKDSIIHFFKLSFGIRAVDKDIDWRASLTTRFKKAIQSFYSEEKLPSNNDGISSKIQTIVNQRLFDLLTIHKARLAANEVSLHIDIQRKKYGDSPSLTFQERRYPNDRNTAIYEEIYSVRTYRSKHSRLKKIVNKEIAHYSVVEKLKVDLKERLHCPNCGAESSYAGLLDGCDYCGAGFRIDDLKRTITAFAFRRDFQTRYNKFETLKARVMLVISLIYLLLTVVCTLALFSWGLTTANAAEQESVVFVWIGVFWATAILIALMTVTIVPMSAFIAKGINKLIAWLSKNRLANSYIKRQQKTVSQTENYVKQYNKNFILAIFLSEIQTKISLLFMANKARTIDGVTDFDAVSFPIDKSIVDVLFKEINILSYTNDEINQYITLSAEIILLKKVGKRLKKQHSKKQLTVRKKRHSRTADAFFELRCPTCGSNLSTLDGKICSSCRNEVDISQYEWMIVSIN